VLLDEIGRAMKNRLKELRQLHSLSQADLARESNISRQAINGFESGKFDPSLEMAFKIANRFNVPIQDVFIHEEKQSMPTILERITSFFGLNIGFERFTDRDTPISEATQKAYKESVDLGMPSAASFTLQIYPIDFPLKAEKNSWIVKRKDSQFLWILES
jgi:DNA-binding XRE family transcriptional regulator